MKTGRNIVDLAREIQRRSHDKVDLVTDTRHLGVYVPPGHDAVRVAMPGYESFGLTKHASRQVGTWAGMPAKYHDFLRDDHPVLLAHDLNYFFQNAPANRMLRTLDGDIRAYLSDRYRRLDNEDVCEAALPILMDSPDLQVVSAEVTESRLYIKAIFPRVQRDVALNDPVQAGVVISNSEIGLGSLSVQPLVYRLVCLNGMIAADKAWRKYHVGARIEADDPTIYRQETLAADDKALMLKLQDAIRSASTETFTAITDRMIEAQSGEKIEKPMKGVEVLGKQVGLNGDEQESVLERLIRDGDYSKYGAMNAVTQLANDVDDYDRATELEALGGKIITLANHEWHTIAQAA